MLQDVCIAIFNPQKRLAPILHASGLWTLSVYLQRGLSINGNCRKMNG